MFEAFKKALPRFRVELAEMEKDKERIMAEFSREQGLSDHVELEPAFRAAQREYLARTSMREPEYRAPDTIGWVRGWMPESLFENAFEPYLNDLLLEAAEDRQRNNQSCARLELTKMDRRRITLMALMYSLWTASRLLLRGALRRISAR